MATLKWTRIITKYFGGVGWSRGSGVLWFSGGRAVPVVGGEWQWRLNVCTLCAFMFLFFVFVLVAGLGT